MHSWELIDAYSHYHPRWFESSSTYTPGDEHLACYREVMPADREVRRRGLWYISTAPGGPMPGQGWKIHVSVRAADSVNCLRRALPCLLDEAVSFKFLVDRATVSLVNGKLWPRGSSGKFITAYPRSEEEFLRLGRRLTRELQDLTGPYILSDRRWLGSGCVHYRYGGFSPRTVLQADGRRQFVITAPDGQLTPDLRLPYFSAPDWARDPVRTSAASGPSEAPEPRRITTLSDGRYLMESALSFSNRGGVYRATDRSTEEDVVIKESRPGIEVGRQHLDAVDVLKKEYRLLGRLCGSEYFVRPREYFEEDGHAFLVEDFVPGDHLGRYTIRRNPLYRVDVTDAALDRYYADMRGLWTQLARAIASAHRQDIVLGDLSFGNVLVEDDTRIRIIDMECAVEDGIDPHVGLHTPGMAAQRTLRTGTSDRANDCYALGSIILGSVMLANGIIGLHQPARRRFLAALTSDLSLSAEFVALVDDLMEPVPGREPAMDEVAEVIAEVPVRTAAVRGLTSRSTARFAGSSPRPPDAPSDDTRELCAQTRDAAVEYLLGTADPARDDRLFPADLSVFETNPLSVAFGAAGVLHAVHGIRGAVPPHLTQWLLDRDAGNDLLPPGLYLGQAGVAWVLDELGRPELALTVLRDARRHDLLLDSPNVLHGAAGYGLACLRLWQNGLDDGLLEEASRIGDHLLTIAVRDDRGTRWRDSAGETPLGYAFGGSGIALFLLYLYCATGEPRALEAGRSALAFELGQARWHAPGELAGFPAFEPRDLDAEEVVPRCYWDIGSAGVLTTLIRYLAVAPDADLENWLEPLARDAERKYTVFPQLFHGLAGLGNALLDLWDFTEDARYLHSAWRTAEGVLLSRIPCPEGVAFPGEQAVRESADFATGAAGVALFLDRLLNVGKATAGNFNFVVDELLRAAPGPRASAT
ncbi:class III lanthionine synthetase LanKC [Kitasatospora sp. NPDC093102]|uniref:class III lanthionine synthetase LanKC n=1 Tax=Kitasatospora sp. NPDC093102 TaxID=3155069 RepID=UPI003437AC5C